MDNLLTCKNGHRPMTDFDVPQDRRCSVCGEPLEPPARSVTTDAQAEEAMKAITGYLKARRDFRKWEARAKTAALVCGVPLERLEDVARQLGIYTGD